MTDEQKPVKYPPVPEFDGHALTPRQRAFGTAFAVLASVYVQQAGAPPQMAAMIRDRLLVSLYMQLPGLDADLQTAAQEYVQNVLAWHIECAKLAPRIIPLGKPGLKVIQ